MKDRDTYLSEKTKFKLTGLAISMGLLINQPISVAYAPEVPEELKKSITADTSFMEDEITSGSLDFMFEETAKDLATER